MKITTPQKQQGYYSYLLLHTYSKNLRYVASRIFLFTLIDPLGDNACKYEADTLCIKHHIAQA
jgi:hypothetical protein